MELKGENSTRKFQKITRCNEKKYFKVGDAEQKSKSWNMENNFAPELRSSENF